MNRSPTRKKSAPRDWHPADIVAALRKRGWSLRKLSMHHGYYPTLLTKALRSSYPRAERLVADAIGVPPEEIWPERYARRAQDTTRRGRRRAA